jgi:hypothetical protein
MIQLLAAVRVGIGIGVWWYIWGTYGFWWGVLYGVFWEVWVGFKLATYLVML